VYRYADRTPNESQPGHSTSPRAQRRFARRLLGCSLSAPAVTGARSSTHPVCPRPPLPDRYILYTCSYPAERVRREAQPIPPPLGSSVQPRRQLTLGRGSRTLSSLPQRKFRRSPLRMDTTTALSLSHASLRKRERAQRGQESSSRENTGRVPPSPWSYRKGNLQEVKAATRLVYASGRAPQSLGGERDSAKRERELQETRLVNASGPVPQSLGGERERAQRGQESSRLVNASGPSTSELGGERERAQRGQESSRIRLVNAGGPGPHSLEVKRESAKRARDPLTSQRKWPSTPELSPYKILFHFKALLWESISLLSSPT